MRISIFGMGYVGCVGAACCAKLGHHVIGVDVSSHKVELINQGRPTIIEKDIDELVKYAHAEGRLEATVDAAYAVNNSEISFIAVGTPSSKEGHLNLEYIYKVAGQIGMALKDKDNFHIIAIRSTVLPGTNGKIGEIIEEVSGKKRNRDFTVVSNPEFLREGTAVHDYLNPPLTLVGADNEMAVDKMRALYRDIPGEFIATDIKVAEMMDAVLEEVGGYEAGDEPIRRAVMKLMDGQLYDRTGLVYGFGHAVYTISDPRADMLKACCNAVAKEKNLMTELEFRMRFEEIARRVMEERKGKPLPANVDYYSGFAYEMLGIPRDLYTPLFMCSRTVGWLAHNIENKLYDGRIMRPATKYVGGENQEYVSMEDR